MITLVFYWLAAYLIGSIPNGYLIGRLRGVDIRAHGSGNIGATNVFRVLGKPWGIGCFLLDALKGWLAVKVATAGGESAGVDLAMAGIGGALAGILGHNYTPWLGFKGGKGIATSAGALIALMPLTTLVVLLVWMVVFWVSRIVSLASIAAALALPLVCAAVYFIHGEMSAWLVGFAVVAGGVAVWRHRSNIGRLLAGTEHRFGGGPKARE